MDARLNYQGNAVAMKFVKYLTSAGKGGRPARERRGVDAHDLKPLLGRLA